MAEEIGAANLGDLEGFARDMSEEVRQIRQVVRARPHICMYVKPT